MVWLNVLITAASRRVPLVRAFQQALARPGVRGRVVVTDVNRMSPAVHVADRAFRVPYSNDPAYLDEIASICRAQDISLIVPTIDDEVPLFAGARADFEASGIRVAVASPETASVCADKYSTCTTLRRAGIAAAETWLPSTLPASWTLPLFIKPRAGRGGVQAFRAVTRDEVQFFLKYVHDPVIQEYLDGPEYTLDMLCDFDGQPLSIVPRQRVVVRAGVMDRGHTCNDPALIDLARQCAGELRFAGAANIQCRVVDGVPTVFEINPRFSGGIPLTIAAGADFAAMLVDLAIGRTVRPAIGDFTPDLWMSSYETSVFLQDGGRALKTCPRPGAEEVA